MGQIYVLCIITPLQFFWLIFRRNQWILIEMTNLKVVSRMIESRTKPRRIDENKAEHRTAMYHTHVVQQQSRPRTVMHVAMRRCAANHASRRGRAPGPACAVYRFQVLFKEDFLHSRGRPLVGFI